jgi:hypothetical protein
VTSFVATLRNCRGGMAYDGAPKGFTEGHSCCSRRGPAARCLDHATGPGTTDRPARIISELGSALEARRQRIIISHAEVNSVKWVSLCLQAICELLVIALVHCGNRLASGIAMGLFATGRGRLCTADRCS